MPITKESLQDSSRLSAWVDALDWALAVKDPAEIKARRDRMWRELVEALRPADPGETP